MIAYINPSAPAVSTISPSASQATHHTASACAGSCLKALPLLTSHIIVDSSKLPVARRLDLGEKATESTGAVCETR